MNYMKLTRQGERPESPSFRTELTNNMYVRPPYLTCDKCGMMVEGRQRKLKEHKQQYHSY